MTAQKIQLALYQPQGKDFFFYLGFCKR